MEANSMIQFSGGTLTIGNFSMTFSLSGVVEMLIFTVAIYYIIVWIKRTQAWNLLKGLFFILAAYIIARLFRLNNIVTLFDRSFSSVLIAMIVILQPELRRALDQLGTRSFFGGLLRIGDSNGNELTTESVNAVVEAMRDLGARKVGALIVFERTIELDEQIKSGITLDSVISAQLLIQIFEHNTPLHDGAVIIRNNKIASATCYLPLSPNNGISKELGTRHRAGLGVSEISDCITLIASEETGALSIAMNGTLKRSVTPEQIREVLINGNNVTAAPKKFSERIKESFKGGQKHEK